MDRFFKEVVPGVVLLFAVGMAQLSWAQQSDHSDHASHSDHADHSEHMNQEDAATAATTTDSGQVFDSSQLGQQDQSGMRRQGGMIRQNAQDGDSSDGQGNMMQRRQGQGGMMRQNDQDGGHGSGQGNMMQRRQGQGGMMRQNDQDGGHGSGQGNMMQQGQGGMMRQNGQDGGHGDGQGGMMQGQGNGDRMQRMRMRMGMGNGRNQSADNGNQDAFSAIQAVVQQLEANPDTDWSSINIDALRDHLIDMHEVSVNAEVATTEVEGGASYRVTGNGRTVEAIRNMVPMHASQMTSETEWTAVAEQIRNGVEVTVTADSEAQVAKIRALGFMGFMVSGDHHEMHHMAIVGADMEGMSNSGGSHDH